MDSEQQLERILNLNLDAYFEEVERLINLPETINNLTEAIEKMKVEDVGGYSMEKMFEYWQRLGDIDEERAKFKRDYDFWKGNLRTAKANFSMPWELIDKVGFAALQTYISSNLEDQIKEYEKKEKFGLLATDEIKNVISESDFSESMYTHVVSGKPPLKGPQWLPNYGRFFILISYVQYLNDLSSNEKALKEKRQDLSLPEKVMLLVEMGYLHHNADQWPNVTMKNRVLSLLLSVDETNLKKNINALKKASANFNPHKYKGILARLLES